MASFPLNVNLAIHDVWMLDYAFLLKCSSNVLAIVCKIRRFRFFKLKKTKITPSTKPRQQSVTIIRKQKLVFVFCIKHALQFAKLSWFLLDYYALSKFLFVVSVHLTRGVKKFDDARGRRLDCTPPSTAKLPAQTFATCKSTYATKM